MELDPQRVRSEGEAALAKGKLKPALECFSRLEQLEPFDPEWSRKVAEIHRRQDDRPSQLAASARAAEKYARAGFFVKAIAMYKLVLVLDPHNQSAKTRLAMLNALPIVRGETTKGARTQDLKMNPADPLERVPLLDLMQAPPYASATDSDPSRIVELKLLNTGEFVVSELNRPKASPVHEPFEEPVVELTDLVEDDLESEGLGGAESESSLSAQLADEVAVLDAEAVNFPPVPLFSALSAKNLTKLIDSARLVELEIGQVLFEEGAIGKTFYVVAAGSVEVCAAGKAIACLEEGQFFGEIALLTDEPRSASIVARERTQLLEFDRFIMGELVQAEPSVFSALLGFVRDRLIDRLVQTNPLFAPYSGAERATLSDRFLVLEAPHGAMFVRQNERSPGLYILVTGRAEVLEAMPKGPMRPLAILEPGDLFGEISLLQSEPAAASVRAKGKCLALKLPAEEFREVIMTHPEVLAYVGEIAERRKSATSGRKPDAASGAEYEEWHLRLV